MASGLLGSADLSSPNTDVLIYTVPAGRSVTFNVRYCNRNATPANVTLAIGKGSSPSLKDFVTFNQTIPMYGIIEDVGFMASDGEKLWVRGAVSGISVRVHGSES